ncbi:Stabilin-1 [Larimichthys crocea]|uniref:Uncharacterized protein n=1 Tax=Larimichthys crocea TaxID=215358 RepID=A0ACD3RII8_LARCR|nr:Stabilin-1 [Larimichthys crocea]
MPLLLLLLLRLQTSLQEQSATSPPGRCDISQRQDLYTSCTSLAACSTSSCPHGFSSVGKTNCSYVVQIGGREMELEGCRHLCVKAYMEPLCCPQYWGPLCLPCPSWSQKTCNFHGTCQDTGVGNGTCVCEDGFSGFACQECKKENYYGDMCDKVSTRCSNCSPYSYCKGTGDTAACECLPGYRKSPQGKCASVCSARDCDVNAQCSSQGAKVSCVCKAGYEGDGRICVPKNPCSENNGGCPVNSTICVFKGPNKSSCECMSGMTPVAGSAEFGCHLVSACSADTCDPTAVCRTELDGHPR